jgi:hypothetical protein
MCPHQYYHDAYYAEQAILHEAQHRTYVDEPRPEIEIPIRWIMAWLATVTTLGMGIGGILHWIA